jgi:hypothetical protein
MEPGTNMFDMQLVLVMLRYGTRISTPRLQRFSILACYALIALPD